MFNSLGLNLITNFFQELSN